uniref:Uncharacterized protein n=1 Tax=uncultured Acidobacteriota bacterium TaxID=171953 RepID=Q7X2T9_9BACT|nr:hypothetical protein [uncultured Acidobacteriota bacterium]
MREKSMKNIKSELNDWGRPEYKRSDFGEIVRGKYANTQVDFAELTALLLAVIGEDEAIKFIPHSTDNRIAARKFGDWTYEIDNAIQITLRYWLSEFGSIEEAISSPPIVMTPKDRAELHDALLKGVTRLKTKVAAR